MEGRGEKKLVSETLCGGRGRGKGERVSRPATGKRLEEKHSRSVPKLDFLPRSANHLLAIAKLKLPSAIHAPEPGKPVLSPATIEGSGIMIHKDGLFLFSRAFFPLPCDGHVL